MVAGVGQDQEDAERQDEELQLRQQSRQDVSDKGPRNVEVLLVGAPVPSAAPEVREEGLLCLFQG